MFVCLHGSFCFLPFHFYFVCPCFFFNASKNRKKGRSRMIKTKILKNTFKKKEEEEEFFVLAHAHMYRSCSLSFFGGEALLLWWW